MSSHIPVMTAQVLEALLGGEGPVERVIDGTVGAGGHSQALLAAGARAILALDLDPIAIAGARQRLAAYRARISFCQCSYLQMRERAAQRGWDSVDAILLDLGLSSLQLDDPARGFSFRRRAPMDMRFDQTAEQPTAQDLVNSLDERELADIFYKHGEEPAARRIARAIVEARPIRDTVTLAELVANAASKQGRSAKIHPATRVFQALRITVNQELEAVAAVMPQAVDLLRPGGRLAVISFHSLEDRIVKSRLRELATEVVSPPGMASIKTKRARIRLVTRKPLRADGEEIARNPRSRSAKLRVAEKLDCP